MPPLPETRSTKQAAVLAEQFGELAIGPDSATFRSPAKSTQPAPPVIKGSAAAMLAINRIGVPSALLAALKHAASHHNPEFYEKEKHRFSTWNTPRIIRCYRETLDALLLPRGLRDKAATLITEAGSRLEVTDRYADTEPIDLAAQMVLTADQATARDAMSKHDLGVLVAPPGSGKTVVGCALIARHSTPTLVIVDRKPLVEQWRDRLQTHLGLTTRQIGQIGGGRKRAGGLVDVAMIQSLARREDIAELTSRYGLVIVDECHHVPAVTFERAVREMPVRKWLGLTATPYRRDGLQALMAMHCGPTRHRMPEQSRIALLSRDLIVHHTDHRGAENDQHIQAVFRALVEDDKRTRYIASEIGQALATGRNCLVLTRWTEHLGRITDALREQGHNPLVLHGGVAKMARAATIEQLDNASGNQPMLLVATASLLGEGFDCPPLDTLFLAFPIKFKGSVVQCVGRILRPTDTKTRIEVHDYVDVEVSVLARMHEARLSAYKSLGFDVPRTRPPEPDPGTDRPSTIIDNE